jgi:hypothetical protein
MKTIKENTLPWVSDKKTEQNRFKEIEYAKNDAVYLSFYNFDENGLGSLICPVCGFDDGEFFWDYDCIKEERLFCNCCESKFGNLENLNGIIQGEILFIPDYYSRKEGDPIRANLSIIYSFNQASQKYWTLTVDFESIESKEKFIELVLNDLSKEELNDLWMVSTALTRTIKDFIIPEWYKDFNGILSF